MRNQRIQLSNDVTVTLFLNQFSQNFELCLEMIIITIIIIITSAQNASYCHGNTSFLRVLLTNRVLKISDDVPVTSFPINLNKILYLVCYTKRHLCTKFEQNRTRNKEVAKIGKLRHCDVISKNSSAIFRV